MLIDFIKGFIVGMGASIPLGPMGVMCVQKTLSKGRNSGFISGLGASITDTFFAAIAVLALHTYRVSLLSTREEFSCLEE